MPVTDGIFLVARSPLVAIGFGSCQELVGGDISSSIAARVARVKGTGEWLTRVQQGIKIAIQGGRHCSEASAGLGVVICTHERSHYRTKR